MVKASALEKSGTWVRVLASVRCILSSVLLLRCVGRSNFDKGLHILTTTLIQNSYNHKNCYIIYMTQQELTTYGQRTAVANLYLYIKMLIHMSSRRVSQKLTNNMQQSRQLSARFDPSCGSSVQYGGSMTHELVRILYQNEMMI